MPWPTTPRWAQRQAPMASPPGLEHQATLAPHAQGPAPPPSPRTPARTRAHTHTRAPRGSRLPASHECCTKCTVMRGHVGQARHEAHT